MQLTGGEFDVIVIGSGRSGRETALAATREGCSTLLISLSPGTIASMMWSTSDESLSKQELIQAFIPSGDENKKQPTVTIQTTLNRPNHDAPIYVLQAQVQRSQRLPGSDASTVLQIGEPQTSSSGPSRSLREREMRIRKKLLRRNSHPPAQDEKEEAAFDVKTEPKTTGKREVSSIYQQRNNYLRRKLLVRPNGRDKTVQIPPQPRRNEEEEKAEMPKRDSSHTSKDSPPIPLPASKDATGLSESLIPMDRSRRKKQRNDSTAKVHPLIYRESPVQEKKASKNRFQTLVWEDSKGGYSAAVRKEKRSKGQPKAAKMRFADDGTEKKKSVESEALSVPPPHSKAASHEQHIEQRTAPEQPETIRQGNKHLNSDSKREKKKVSFIEREQARKILEQSSSTPLKREAIQLEDPYGFDAWEEIMPFSRGKDNKSTLDASEKRKIALRGLRNLINNLG